MKSLSVSDFKTKLAAHLREVRAGETLIITEHRNPIARVESAAAEKPPLDPAAHAFSLEGSLPTQPCSGLWKALLDSDRAES